MEPNEKIPKLVESYKALLYRKGSQAPSLKSYCARHNLRYASVQQWMGRRNMSVATLQLSVLLDKSSGQSQGTPVSDLPSLRDWMFGRYEAKEGKAKEPCVEIPVEDLLQGVTLTFPDGLVVQIRRASNRSVVNFIEQYDQSQRPL